MGSPEHPFLSDEFVAAEIARALAPFDGLLDPEELAKVTGVHHYEERKHEELLLQCRELGLP
jgi:hypothetical protein